MRKSLLLINPLLIGAIIFLGQCPRTVANENKTDSREIVSGDTLTNAHPGMMADTAIIDSLDAYEVRIDTTKPRRIEHGSDNAAKLDSIKKAKTKKKK